MVVEHFIGQNGPGSDMPWVGETFGALKEGTAPVPTMHMFNAAKSNAQLCMLQARYDRTIELTGSRTGLMIGFIIASVIVAGIGMAMFFSNPLVPIGLLGTVRDVLSPSHLCLSVRACKHCSPAACRSN